MKIKIIKDIELLENMPSLVQGDQILLGLRVRHDDDSYYDLSDTDSMDFNARLTNESVLKFTENCTIASVTSGVASMTLSPSDLASSGVYIGEFTFSSSSEIRTINIGKFYVQEQIS